MKIRIVLAASAALVLGACGKSGETAATATASAEAAPSATATPVAAESGAAPAAAAAGSAPTKAFFVGKWAEEGLCDKMAIDFKADGTMDGPFDGWSLDDKGVLTMIGAPQKSHLKVVDQDTLESRIDGTAPPRKLTRCK